MSKYYAVRMFQVRKLTGFENVSDFERELNSIPEKYVDFDAVLMPFDAIKYSAAKDTARNWFRSIESAELAALRARVAELESAQAVVTPNNCRHCHKAAEKMREAAAKLSDEYVLPRLSRSILALPLPTCGDCNPLAPSKPVDECPVCGCENGQHSAVCMFK